MLLFLEVVERTMSSRMAWTAVLSSSSRVGQLASRSTSCMTLSMRSESGLNASNSSWERPKSVALTRPCPALGEGGTAGKDQRRQPQPYKTRHCQTPAPLTRKPLDGLHRLIVLGGALEGGQLSLEASSLTAKLRHVCLQHLDRVCLHLDLVNKVVELLGRVGFGVQARVDSDVRSRPWTLALRCLCLGCDFRVRNIIGGLSCGQGGQSLCQPAHGQHQRDRTLAQLDDVWRHKELGILREFDLAEHADVQQGQAALWLVLLDEVEEGLLLLVLPITNPGIQCMDPKFCGGGRGQWDRGRWGARGTVWRGQSSPIRAAGTSVDRRTVEGSGMRPCACVCACSAVACLLCSASSMR